MHDPFSDEILECWTAQQVAASLLKKAMDFSSAPMGNVQLLDRRTGFLEIVVHKGFGREFLEVFARVDIGGSSVCAQALRQREIVTVDDVQRGTGALPGYGKVFARANVRAVQSIPIVSSDKEILGMLSTHFPQAMRLGAAELVTMRHFADLAAERLRPLLPLPVPRRPSKANLAAWGKLGFKSKN